MNDLEQAAQRVQTLVAPFFNGLVIAQLLLYGGAAIVLRHSWAAGAQAPAAAHPVRRTALVFACVPVSTYLANTVPWWRDSMGAAAGRRGDGRGYVTVLTVVAQLGTWRHRCSARSARWPG